VGQWSFCRHPDVLDEQVTTGNQRHNGQPNRLRLALMTVSTALCSRSILLDGAGAGNCPLPIGSRFRIKLAAFYMLRARVARKSWLI
jgi:hypothetical protein